MEKVDVPANPGRLINAIANIGYDPEVAICDLIDNCIDAKAKKISVEIEKGGQEDEGQSDAIRSYTITDDGIGMDRDTLIGAFTLGTKRDYPHGSLGKFGLGLKSAGLSLGGEIVILTKKTGADPLCAKLSIADIEQSESGKYEIDLGDIPNEFKQHWDKSKVEEHGTVLVIRALNESQPPYSSFSEYLKRYCSIVFHRFIEGFNRSEGAASSIGPIDMSIGSTSLKPFDPLFLSQAIENDSLGDPKSWEGKTIHLLLKDESFNLDEPIKATIAATHLVHPPSFGKERSKIGERYAIVRDPYTRRPRHGFYVYRNNRIIVLAERFHGLIGAQVPNWAFRARLMFDESADSILSLDVKKRHCQLPRGARTNLKALIGSYQAKSVAAWEAAGTRMEDIRRESKDNIANDSISTTPVISLDYMPSTTLNDDASIQMRKQRQDDISNETRNAIHDSRGQELLEEHGKEGDVVVLVDGLKANAMWMSYPSVSLGMAETIVNKHHSWVAEAYSAAEQESSVTIVLHQLFTILARAELEVRSTPWKDVSKEDVDKIFDRFRKRVSTVGEDLAEHLISALKKDTLGGEVE